MLEVALLSIDDGVGFDPGHVMWKCTFGSVCLVECKVKMIGLSIPEHEFFVVEI